MEIWNGPVERPAAIPGWGRIGRDEADASVQLIGDIHIIGPAVSQIFIGQGVGQDLSHWSRIGVGGLVDGQVHNIQDGLGSPIVIVFAVISLSGALIRADSRLAGPGEVCRYDYTIAWLALTDGIETDDGTLSLRPVQRVNLPAEVLFIK